VRPNFTPIPNNRQNDTFVYFNVWVFRKEIGFWTEW
jgi:hypothetical protein